MRGMATLQTFEELSCQEPDNPDVRKHSHFCLHAWIRQKRTLSKLNTFLGKNYEWSGKPINSPMFASSLLQDEQSDSGMVLPSEELKHMTWSNSTKKLSRWWHLTFDLLTLEPSNLFHSGQLYLYSPKSQQRLSQGTLQSKAETLYSSHSEHLVTMDRKNSF